MALWKYWKIFCGFFFDGLSLKKLKIFLEFFFLGLHAKKKYPPPLQGFWFFWGLHLHICYPSEAPKNSPPGGRGQWWGVASPIPTRICPECVSITFDLTAFPLLLTRLNYLCGQLPTKGNKTRLKRIKMSLNYPPKSLWQFVTRHCQLKSV